MWKLRWLAGMSLHFGLASGSIRGDALHCSKRWSAGPLVGYGASPQEPQICPISGRYLVLVARKLHACLVSIDQGLVQHVIASTGLSAAAAARLVQDVVAFHAESVEDVVRRRHAEMQLVGRKNPEIFARLREELAERVVAAPDLTERQLRRIVYG